MKKIFLLICCLAAFTTSVFAEPDKSKNKGGWDKKNHYLFEIHTADEATAGTDSKIFISALGTSGGKYTFRVQDLDYVSESSYSNFFERGNVDRLWLHTDADIGDIFHIEVNAYTDGWYPSKITIKNPSNWTAEFKNKQWTKDWTHVDKHNLDTIGVTSNVVSVGSKITALASNVFMLEAVGSIGLGVFKVVEEFKAAAGYYTKSFSASNRKYYVLPPSGTSGPMDVSARELQANESMKAKDFIYSGSYENMFHFGEDGNLVKYKVAGIMDENYIISPTWASGTNTDHRAKSGHLILQNDCNLVLYGKHKKDAIWSTKTWEKKGKCKLSMQDDGNLVLYRGDGKAIWVK